MTGGAAPDAARSPLPFGSWPTPVTSELVVRASSSPNAVAIDGGMVWWSEQRPEEGGRTAILHRPLDASAPAVDVLPPPWNARTRVHEYGGGAWWVHDGVLWFAEFSDQRLYRVDPGGEPVVVTPPPERPGGDRYADGVVTADGSVLCVRERHPIGGGPAAVSNELVRLPDGVLVSGPDFVSDPRPSPDGTRLAWLEWDHPDMPWDATRLMVDGRVVAGDAAEWIFQPAWGPDGWLYFVSDRTGWSTLYRWRDDAVERVAALDGDIATPQWVFGSRRYGFLDGGRIVFAFSHDGVDRLALLLPDGSVSELGVPDTSIASVATTGSTVVYIGASATDEPAVVALDVDGDRAGERRLLRPPRQLDLDPSFISTPEPITFPTTGGATAHALFYAPANPRFEGPPGERPPLLVFIHGGPTSAARPMLQLATQYWTTRGVAVVDVNYRGSTGYGRAYREALNGHWGVADVDDCVACARWLADQGRVDPERLWIRGGSAGGFTVLAALAFRDVFAAGASHYGVADLEALARDTHKFEARYLDRLVGPYPEGRDVYVERSPIHHVDGIDRPLAVFQGLEDEVVPPNQAEMIVEAVRAKGVPVAYVAFEGEQHGFRRAENIRAALDGELSFYAQVFGFELPPAEAIEPITISPAPGPATLRC